MAEKNEVLEYAGKKVVDFLFITLGGSVLVFLGLELLGGNVLKVLTTLF